ncbi:hypothetical protein N7493_001727 [Penicillium malachiteum]|uniref:Uncharacterized protein n=1 Tax=Penicillium malachiteum TaxID=1324776 RepID=A0AAD6N023_9EURO|nr:hypothetical protein N7493_001727 [Penicillium malachiteum]
MDRLGTLNPDGTTKPGDTVFAFWLSHGLTDDHNVRIERLARSNKRAQDIEEAFQQIESPPIGVIVIDFQAVFESPSTI